MTLKASVAKTTMTDSFEAGRELARSALDQFGEEKADIAILFATSGHDQRQLMSGIGSTLDTIPIAGCSGEGVITQAFSRETNHAAAMMLLQSDIVRFHSFCEPSYATDPRGSAKTLVQKIRQREGDSGKLLWVFSDGLSGNCSAFLDTLSTELDGLTIVGGASADAMTFEKTYQYYHNEVYSGAVVAVLIAGEMGVDVSVSHGCLPIGLSRIVTEASDGWLKQIDDRPAWDVFKEYLDGDPQDLEAEGIVHLCVGTSLSDNEADEYGDYIIRTPFSLDKEAGSLFFPGGGIHQGQCIRMSRRDEGRIRKSVQVCAQKMLARHNNQAPSFVLQFDCAGRGRVFLGNNAAETTVFPLQQALGTSIPWLGFHSFGEIAPIVKRPYYHNYSMALCAVYC